MHPHGNIAVGNFVASCGALSVALTSFPHTLNLFFRLLLLSFALFIASYVFTKKFLYPEVHDVVWRAQFLGLVFTSGINVAISTELYSSFGWYMIVMSFFHFSEYYVTSIIRPQSLNNDSFLLNHSKAYGIAALASWLEFLLELWLTPGLKHCMWIRYAGLILCAGGEITRKLAMLTAGSNFDHLVRVTREANHRLVTSGIYGAVRHPSYVGWFYWSIGTQLVLCNPLCFFAYLCASWKFFHERILQEEITLLNFFGQDYVEYQRNVPTGLPFIKGYELQ